MRPVLNLAVFCAKGVFWGSFVRCWRCPGWRQNSACRAGAGHRRCGLPLNSPGRATARRPAVSRPRAASARTPLHRAFGVELGRGPVFLRLLQAVLQQPLAVASCLDRQSRSHGVRFLRTGSRVQ